MTHLELTEDELDQIKIGYFKEYPMTPEQVAHQICYRHVYKITNSRYREGSKSVQGVRPDQFRRYGEILDRMLNENHILVIGNERRLQESSLFFDHVFPVSP
ncbi:MAG: hypothetical protein Q4A41_06040 [Bacillota bacterium]|nr:hypothetical protein [Bacillota bacterium]